MTVALGKAKPKTLELWYIRVIIGLYWGYIGIMEKKMETTYYCRRILITPTPKSGTATIIQEQGPDFRGLEGLE